MIAVRGGDHGDAVLGGFPGRDRLVEAKRGATARREVEMRAQHIRRVQVSGAAIDHRGVRLVWTQGWKSTPDLVGIEVLEGQSQLLCRFPGSAHDSSGGDSHHQAAGQSHERRPRLPLELRPQVVGAPEDGHVQWVLVIELPNDATLAVRGAQGMTGGVAIQPQRADTARGQMIGRRATHRPQADHDRVVRVAHAGPLAATPRSHWGGHGGRAPSSPTR